MQKEHQEKTPKNNIEEIIQTIKDHIENKMFIRIERAQIDENEKIEGFPLFQSEKLLLISKVVDFRDEGFLIMRIEDITEAYSKESDTFYEEICVKEGLQTKMTENPITDITDFTSVIRQLFDYNKFITIQCEYTKNELYYSIGTISSIGKDVIKFNNFDKMGIWEDTERLISLNEITLVSIEDYYSSVFYKYVKPFSEN